MLRTRGRWYPYHICYIRELLVSQGKFLILSCFHSIQHLSGPFPRPLDQNMPYTMLSFLRPTSVDDKTLFSRSIQWFLNLVFTKETLLLALSLYPILSSQTPCFERLSVPGGQAKFIWKLFFHLFKDKYNCFSEFPD